MKTVEEHLADVLAVVRPLGPLEVPLLDAHGCVLADDIVSDAAVPSFANSAMDGYAVVAADVAGAEEARPALLPVDGDVPAGPAPALTVAPGRCVRIMTGAVLPPGADAVVPVEWTDGGVAEVRVFRPAEPGLNIRGAGEDVRPGQTVLTAGTVLGPAQVGLLAVVGRPAVRVRPRPRVVVLSTGSELVEPGRPLAPGQIHDSNSYALTAAAREAGAQATRAAGVPDDPRALRAALEDLLVRADLVVTSGGVSVGAYDVVKQVLREAGTVTFSQVAMQPGKPQAFGTLGPAATPFFGLPGNPVSALVSFEVFVRPALRRMLGLEPVQRPPVTAVLSEPVRKLRGRRQYRRVTLTERDGVAVATPVGGTGSHLMAGLAAAGGLAVLPEDVDAVPAGGAVDVLVLGP